VQFLADIARHAAKHLTASGDPARKAAGARLAALDAESVFSSRRPTTVVVQA
jgi:hypothetical protein